MGFHVLNGFVELFRQSPLRIDALLRLKWTGTRQPCIERVKANLQKTCLCVTNRAEDEVLPPREPCFASHVVERRSVRTSNEASGLLRDD